jgi:hypothetical protein
MAQHSTNMDASDWQGPDAHQIHFSDKKPLSILPASTPTHLGSYLPVALDYYGHPELRIIRSR